MRVNLHLKPHRRFGNVTIKVQSVREKNGVWVKDTVGTIDWPDGQIDKLIKALSTQFEISVSGQHPIG